MTENNFKMNNEESSDDDDIFTGFVTKNEIIQRLKNYGIYTEENIKSIQHLRPKQALTINQLNYYMDLFKRYSLSNDSSSLTSEFNDTISEMEAFMEQEGSGNEPTRDSLKEKLKNAFMSISVFPLQQSYDDSLEEIEELSKITEKTESESKINENCTNSNMEDSLEIVNKIKSLKINENENSDSIEISKYLNEDTENDLLNNKENQVVIICDDSLEINNCQMSRTVEMNDSEIIKICTDSKLSCDIQEDSNLPSVEEKISSDTPRYSKVSPDVRRDSILSSREETVPFDSPRDSKVSSYTHRESNISSREENVPSDSPRDSKVFSYTHRDSKMSSLEENVPSDSRRDSKVSYYSHRNSKASSDDLEDSKLSFDSDRNSKVSSDSRRNSKVSSDNLEDSKLSFDTHGKVSENYRDSKFSSNLYNDSGKSSELCEDVVKSSESCDDSTKFLNLQKDFNVESGTTENSLWNDSLEKNMRALFSRPSELTNQEDKNSCIGDMSSFSVFNLPGFSNLTNSSTDIAQNLPSTNISSSSSDVTHNFPGFPSPNVTQQSKNSEIEISSRQSTKISSSEYSFDADKSSSETQISESFGDDRILSSSDPKMFNPEKNTVTDIVIEHNSYRSECYDSIAGYDHRIESESELSDSVFIEENDVPKVVVNQYTEEEIKYFQKLYEKSNERLRKLQEQIDSLDKVIDTDEPKESKKEKSESETPKIGTKLNQKITPKPPIKNATPKLVTKNVITPKITQITNRLKPTTDVFKTPIKTPIKPKVSKSNFNNIESPVSRYIQESPTIPLKQTVVQKTYSPIICTAQRPFSIGKTPMGPPKPSPVKFSPLPVKSYKPTKNIKMTPVAKENRLPKNVEKVITIPKRAEIIKHTGRVDSKGVLTPKRDNFMDSHLEDSIISELDTTKLTEVSVMITSEAIVKKH